LADYYGQLRRYAPSLLEMFSFQAAPAVKPLIEAIEVLRQMNQSGARLLPDDAPTDFVRRRWAPYVFDGDGVHRKFYELCALSELKNALRAGDVSVPGSRQFRDFDEYLIDRDAFGGQTKEARTGLSLDVDAHEFLNSRMTHLQRKLDRTAQLAQAGELPDVELTERGLKIKTPGRCGSGGRGRPNPGSRRSAAARQDHGSFAGGRSLDGFLPTLHPLEVW